VRFTAVLLLLAAVSGLLTLPKAKEAAVPAGPCFATRAEALDYVTTRILAAESLDGAGDPYSSTFTRSYETVSGEKADYFLVADAARELELAEGFEARGFGREALAHYENLLAFHAGSPQGAVARGRVEACRKKTVLGLVPPMSVVFRDSQGRYFVPAAAASAGKPSLDRIEEPYLERFSALKGPFLAVGFIDDAGSIVLSREETPDPTEPAVVFPKRAILVPESEGAVSSGRDYYLLYRGESLFASERLAKGHLFAEFLGLAGPPTQTDPVECRRAADALVYLGRCDDARKIRAALGDPIPPNPLDTRADDLAADPRSPLHLDALWRLRIRDNPRFVLTTASAVTTGPDLPLEIVASAISTMTFSFAKIEGPLPATEAELKAWLPKAAGTPSHEETFAIAPGQSTLRLPIRAAGTWRVTALARGLSCSFIAVRTDLSLEIFALPGESFLSASRPGITIASAQKSLGTTGEDGALVPTAPMRGRICDEHKACCLNCQSCDHHHADDRGLSANPSIFVTGAGQFFRATAKLDVTEAAKIPAAPATPILFVHTDRPAYKAGDTLRFRGILRLPKAPLLRSDGARLLPGAEREVAVAIRCAEDAIFTRTYVTGEHGTFQGEFTLPLSAYRAEYVLAVTYEGAQASRPFKVIDYRKSDYAIALTPEKGGVRVQAGYVWGAPVSGASVAASVEGRPVAIQDNFIPVPEGKKVRVLLLRGAEELADKELVYRAPLGDEAPPAPKAAEPPPGTSPEAAATVESPAAERPKAAAFAVRTDKALYRRGETIEIEVEGPWAEAEATVVVGDVQVYDLVRIPIRNGRGTARVAARPIHDPGVTVFALCNGAQVRTDIAVRVNQMKLAIEAPPSGRPGEQVEVTLKGDPRAAVALAAVDDAVYMIREDDTPEIYSFFHPARPAALAYAKFGAFEYDGETHKVEKLPDGEHFRTGKRFGRRLLRSAEVYDTMGIGMGGGGGGIYGGRYGGRENRVARGGGTRATESAVSSCLRGLGRLQQPNGPWPGAFASEAGAVSEVGATSLALLSLLGAGYSQLSRDEFPDPVDPARTIRMGEIVKKALRWLLENQAPDGRIGSSADRILNHALAALALSEAYGMTAALPLKDPAQTAMDWLTAQQSTNGGWHRADRAQNGEILTSVFAVMALKSAQLSELPTNPSASARALQYFSETIGEDGLPAGTPTRAQVGGAALARIFLRKARGDTRLLGAATWLVNRPPSWNQPDFLGWYLSSLALFQYDGPDGRCWRAWNDPLKGALLPQQGKNGLWTVGNESVFHTAIGSLSLEVYYRYSNAFGSVGGQGAGPAEQAKFLAPLVPAARVRVYFPDTVHWAPEVITDERGEARLSFRLPDQITTTRLTARGISKSGAAGQAVGRIQTRQPFFVKIVAPEFAVLGDEIEVRVDLYNYANAELEATVRLEGAVGEQKTIVPADRPATVLWRVRADKLAGLRLVAHAASGELRDSMERTVPVRRVGRETPVTSRGKSETGGSFPFEGQKGVQELVLKIHPRTGNLTQVLDALRYLNQYPYG
jgi:hypothetical protein